MLRMFTTQSHHVPTIVVVGSGDSIAENFRQHTY